jgi:hypothetical protein
VTVLRVRKVIGTAEGYVHADRSFEIDGLLGAQLIRDLESAATVLATSSELSQDARRAIGWQWGACGWRLCGAQADAAQALCKLRANLGMATSLEVLFYLDVAKRAVDEILLLGASEGFLGKHALPVSEYLKTNQLEQILAADDEEGVASDAGGTKVLGTRLRAEKQFDLEERMLMEEEEEYEAVVAQQGADPAQDLEDASG